MNISEEAVEAAAKAIYAEGAYCGNCEYAGWDTCGDCRTCCISYAKAAAPYMLAEWENRRKQEALEILERDYPEQTKGTK